MASSSINPEDWSVDANDAVTLSLFNPKTGQEVECDIPPTYTYPLYGDSQTIYGYKDLQIRILFAADDMEPCVEVTWAEKIPKIGGVEAEDVIKPLKENMPQSAFALDPTTFIESLKARKEPFKPAGALECTFKHAGRSYEIWRSSVDDERCRELLENMQILVLLYIEGGTAIELDDEEWSRKRWEVFFLYEKADGEDGAYSMIGYCTLYRYYFFDKDTPDQARVRLSQFLILPPYQRAGHGSRFYDAIVEHYLMSPLVREITVEDPSEEFGDLRDRRDMQRLNQDPDFNAVKLADVVSKKFPLAEVRARAKMPERQFRRCLEMKLLQSLNKKEKKAYKSFRLIVKARIYKQHADVLAQLDRLERIDKLDETYHHVEDDYLRLLQAMKQSQVEEADDESARAKRIISQPESSDRPSKRARVEDADEDDE